MKKVLMLIVVFILITGTCFANDFYYSDNQGNSISGTTDSSGNTYLYNNNTGDYVNIQTDNNGNINGYDNKGNFYQGHIEIDNNNGIQQ